MCSMNDPIKQTIHSFIINKRPYDEYEREMKTHVRTNPYSYRQPLTHICDVIKNVYYTASAQADELFLFIGCSMSV